MSHTVNVFSPAKSDDDRPLVVCQGPTSFGVAGDASATPSVAAGTFFSGAKSASGTRFMLLTNQPSAVVTSNRTAESMSPRKSAFRSVKRSGLHKKLGERRAFQA